MPTINEFKVGDKVRITGLPPYMGESYIGRTGTITETPYESQDGWWDWNVKLDGKGDGLDEVLVKSHGIELVGRQTRPQVGDVVTVEGILSDEADEDGDYIVDFSYSCGSDSATVSESAVTFVRPAAPVTITIPRDVAEDYIVYSQSDGVLKPARSTYSAVERAIREELGR